ncbi:MAG TPA: 5'/3'-nucleotidase SurE [Anaerolineales bacterium]|nr:5'/3'-nucleotidase SurE [Anaerolineales bacterium]
MTSPYQILLTNDDGIQSPGLWTAARALSTLGYVHVVAPRDQFSGAGRSLPSNSDGIITPLPLQVNGQVWQVYSVGGTPAQAVLHALYEILPQPPDLVVSGINYGANIGVGVTVSGTVGAAMEAAGAGIPALAISLETDQVHHLSYSTEVDFSAAGHFTALFGRLLLERRMPGDVHLLKVDVPCDASPDTPWRVTRLARAPFYVPVAPKRTSWNTPETVGYRLNETIDLADADSDASVLVSQRLVSVTPLSLDMTARVPLGELDRLLREE